MGNSNSHRFGIIIGFLLICISLLVSKFGKLTLAEVTQKTNLEIEQKLNEDESTLNSLLKGNFIEKKEKYYELFNSERTGIYIYKKDSLIFWNNAQIPINDSLLAGSSKDGLIQLRQGYYIFKKETNNENTAVALRLVRTKYDLQNNYLRNEFSKWINIPSEVEFSQKTGTEYDVKLNGNSLFSLRSSENNFSNTQVNSICTFLFFAGCLLFFLSVLVAIKKKASLIKTMTALLPLAIMKICMIYSFVPDFILNSIFYDIHIFGNAGSDLNATLADIFFNSCSLLYISIILYLQFNTFKSRIEKNLKLGIVYVLIYLTVLQYNHSIKSLIDNSTLSFDFLSVLNIKLAAAIGLLSLTFNCITLFISLYKASIFFNKEWWRSMIEYSGCALIVCIGIQLTSSGNSIFQNYWLLIFSSAVFILIKLKYQRISLALGLLIGIMSATTSGFLTRFIEEDKKPYLKILSDKLSERQNLYLENEFATLPTKIINDNNLNALISLLPETKKEVGLLLKQKYFSGYFNTYNVDFSMFDKDCKPMLETSKPVLLNEGFFEDKIRYYSDSTFSKELFFIEKYKKNSQYIGKIKLDNYNLYILLEPKQFEELGSFPDLLLDQSQQKQEKLKNTSHAVYRSEKITFKYGEFNYPYYYIDSASLVRSVPGYVQYSFQPDDVTKIFISEKIKGWRYYFTYNSYIFLFFAIISFICYYIYALIFTANFKSSSLTRRIQTIIIVLLLLAMSAVGITSGNLVSRQFEQDNIKQLQEKTQTVISELTTQFKTEELFSSTQKDPVNLKLQEFAHLYNSDISLFDREGKLFNTSQPKLYELGLAASVSNPKAFFDLKENKTSAITVTEKAGTLNYLSLYTPIFNDEKDLIGFINLPYFAKQSDLTNELSNIISTLINVYIILFVISILAGLILAGYITKPLRLIKQQISNITLGKQNETLKWESNDEVGKLVNEYNNMLLKLEHSANLLAQSERESAWREMAKQVAHEIKNPLTPMKLNLQYLQHVMKNNPQDFNEKFEKASSSIIEQIDTLAGIATEFSNFAKLPGTQLQEINLLEIINSSVNLFEQNKHCSIKVIIDQNSMPALGDKEQAIRVFNNVIKNAIQATQETENAVIEITVEEKEESYIVLIKDNGCGISDEMKSKIFTPNFTTKSTGSGLGLAMVKNIMSNFEGGIWFNSEKNTGTTFFIEFKKVK